METILWESRCIFLHPLGLVPEVLNAVNVILAGCKQRRVIDPMMMEITYIQRAIAPVAIRINNAVRRYLLRNERHQCRSFCVIYHFGEYLTTTFQNAEYHHLASGTPTSPPLPRTPKIAFIQLYRAIKYFGRLKLDMMADDLPNLPVKQHWGIRLNVQDVSR